MLVLGVIQTVASVALSLVGITVAFLVYRIQRDRNTAKLMLITGELIEDDERDEQAYVIRIRNVGLVPAVNVRLKADIEEWKDGERLRSTFSEGYRVYSDSSPVLEPQESRSYELPTPGDRDYIFTAILTCRNGTGDSVRYLQRGNSSSIESGRIAYHQVAAGRKAAMKRLARPKASTGRLVFMLNMGLMKRYNTMSGVDSLDPAS